MSRIDEDLERARRESRDCQTCDGNGLTVVYHPRHRGYRIDSVWAGEIDEDGKRVMVPIAMEVAAYCICPLGRWMRDRLDDETRRRTPDVMEIFAGGSQWLLEAPVGAGRTDHAA